jgi:transcriptional regulator with PAS, ATPase and Fis domain
LETPETEEPRPGVYAHLFGHSAGMCDILREIDRAAVSNVPVLITGENGTGKEWMARTIHARSLRRNRPFIKVHCTDLPQGRLESELFGYEKGAFTRADYKKTGAFVFANNGTLFLDEMEEVPLSLQAKLLQVLQEVVFSRIGGKTDLGVNVRVIAATGKIPHNAMEEEGFLRPLFYRLRAITITLPPLRERWEEIPFLVNFLLEKFNRRYNKHYAKLSSHLMKRLMRYDWPGNIRELENVIKQIVVMEDETPVWEKLTGSPAGRIQSPV